MVQVVLVPSAVPQVHLVPPDPAADQVLQC